MTKEKTPLSMTVKPVIEFSSRAVFLVLDKEYANRASFYPDPFDKITEQVHEDMLTAFVKYNPEQTTTRPSYRLELHCNRSFSLMTLFVHTSEKKRGVFRCSNKDMIQRFIPILP